MDEIKNTIPEETKNSGEFTEEMLDSVSKELGLSASENERIHRLREILNGTTQVSEEELNAELFDSGASELDLFNESNTKDSPSMIDLAINGIQENKYSIEDIAEKTKGIFGGEISTNDIKTMLELARRYKNGEEFSVYNAFPDIIKEVVKKEAAGLDRASLNIFSKMVMEEFCTEVFGMTLDAETVDFNQAIAKALDIPDISILYEDYIKDKMEIELISKANALDAEFPEGAKVLRNASKSFTDSYTFVRQRAALTGKTKRKLYKDNCDYMRYVRDFNYKNEHTKFGISDVGEMGRVLFKVSQVTNNGLTEDDVVMFTILFIKTCMNYDHNNTSDAVFMYYTIRNILNMEHHVFIDGGGFKPSSFDTEVLNNIVKLIDDIHVMINERSSK